MVTVNEVNEILQTLPYELKEDISREVNSKSLKFFKFLGNYFSDQTVTELLNVISQVYYMPNQIIFD